MCVVMEGDMALEIVLSAEAAVTGATLKPLRFLFIVSADVGPEVILALLGERAQWAFERPGGCGVRPSI